MNILFVTENFPPERNASAARVYERACYWVKWGHEVTILTCAPNFPEGKVYPGYRNRWYQVEYLDGIRVVRVKTFINANRGIILRTIDFLSFMVMSSFAGFFQRRPDIVMATSPQFFAAVGGWFVSICKLRPFIFELGDLWPASIKAVEAVKNSTLLGMIEKMELFLYRQSAAVVALTPAFKDDLVQRGVEPGKIHVVLNGVDLPRYYPRLKDARLLANLGLEGKFVVGYIGTHGMAHALEKVLDAAALMREDQDVRFLFVGSGAVKDELISKAKKLDLVNVIFHPAQPKERMPDFWSILDVALIHLKNEPVFRTVIPSKIFEAMGMGMPILLAGPEDGEATRIIVEEGVGTCILSEQPSLLVETILVMKNAPKKLEALSRAAAGAAAKYTREAQARNVIEICRSVLSK
ncbi:MAG: glycosyltransferase family 4 protein [Syntrophales bacterium]